MVNSRSGAGGKIVTNRRKQRIAATTYGRPPPSLPLRSPNWFSGVVVPSARAIASGAGKIISAIFSESGSSSSEDEDYVSEDDIVNDNFPEIPCNQESTLNEENETSSEMMQYRQESQLAVWRSETKMIIEQLIMKETFSSEERDRLIKVLNTRVIDWSTEAGQKSSVVGSPGKKLDHENADIFDKAVQEAKKWFQEKKARLSSVTELTLGSSNLNTIMREHLETGRGSPVDLARSYMKNRSPWMSPWKNIESITPSTVSMKLFREGTLYSAGHYSPSSSENRRSFASGSWNIQEELRRVCSREAEDMVCSPSTKTDPSHFAVSRIKLGSAGAVGERMIEPQSLRLHKRSDALVDAGVISQSDLRFSKVTKFVGREIANGLSSSQVSLPIGVADHDDQMKDHIVYTSSENINNVGDDCELLSEAHMEVPIMTETSVTASGCRNSLGVQHEQQSLGIAQPSRVLKHGSTGGEQQGRKTSKYYRRSRGRGK